MALQGVANGAVERRSVGGRKMARAGLDIPTGSRSYRGGDGTQTRGKVCALISQNFRSRVRDAALDLDATCLPDYWAGNAILVTKSEQRSVIKLHEAEESRKRITVEWLASGVGFD